VVGSIIFKEPKAWPSSFHNLVSESMGEAIHQ